MSRPVFYVVGALAVLIVAGIAWWWYGLAGAAGAGTLTAGALRVAARQGARASQRSRERIQRTTEDLPNVDDGEAARTAARASTEAPTLRELLDEEERRLGG